MIQLPPQLKPIARRAAILLALAGTMFAARADDWPQWMGPNRDGVWRESGIVKKFATNGLPILWRTNVNQGYCGPAVVGDRLYMLDRKQGPKMQRVKGDKSIPAQAGNERVLCLNAKTGGLIWEHVYDCPYRIGYPAGPRATPIVAGGKVYTLGAMGDLLCLNAKDGKVIWERHLLKDFELADPPMWGYAAHPLLAGSRLICTVGGSNSAVVAFNKDTGKELWRALTVKEIGYAPPILHRVGGKEEIVVWLADALAGLDPRTGAVLWQNNYPVEGKAQRPEVTIATPRIEQNQVFVSSFYHGATLLQLSNNAAGIGVIWNRKGKGEDGFDSGLHTIMCTPLWRDGYIYGVCGFGELRCLDAKTGDRVWEAKDALGGKPGPFGSAFLIRHDNETFIWTDQGELILSRLTAKGFDEISRAKLLETTENPRGRDITWCHPAFSNRRMFVHNGKELICVSLAAGG